MENCQILKKSYRRSLLFSIGQAVLVIGGIYMWVCDQHELVLFESLIMLLTVSVYYIIRYTDERGIWNRAMLHRFILWCGSNMFGIYLIEDYLRNGTVVIWEKLDPHIRSMPACYIWLIVVFLLGNILITGARRLPLLGKIL